MMPGCRLTTCCSPTTSGSSRRCSPGTVDIGWNTNTAYVVLDHRAGGGTRILGMRDVDRDWASVLVVRKDHKIAELKEELAGGTAGARQP